MAGSSQDSDEQTPCSQVGVSDSLGGFLFEQEEPSFRHVVEYMRNHNGCGEVKVGDGISSTSLTQLKKDKIVIRILKETLNEVNGSHLNIDGKFDSGTESELKSFQKSHGVKETGKLDLKTAEAIIKVLEEQCKRSSGKGSTAVCDFSNAAGHETKRESPVEVARKMIVQYRDVAEKGDVDACHKLYQSLKAMFTKSISSAERKEKAIQWLDNYRSHEGDVVVADYFKGQLERSCKPNAKTTKCQEQLQDSSVFDRVRDALLVVQGLIDLYSNAATRGSSVDCDMSYQALRTFFTKPEIAGGVEQAKVAGESFDSYRAQKGDIETVKVFQKGLCGEGTLSDL